MVYCISYLRYYMVYSILYVMFKLALQRDPHPKPGPQWGGGQHFTVWSVVDAAKLWTLHTKLESVCILYICVHTYICVYIEIDMCTYVYVYVCMYVYVVIYTCIYIEISMCTYTFSYINRYMHVFQYMCIYIVHTYI